MQHSPSAPLGTLRICQLSNRASMGLRESLEVTQVDDLRSVFQEIRTLTREQLTLLVESKTESLSMRFAAGQMLGLVGDPRVTPLQPKMVTLQQATFTMGLAVEKLDVLVSQYKDLRVDREWLEKETPPQTLKIAPLRMGKYLVTNFEYMEFLRANPLKELPRSWEFGIYPALRSNHPVHGISLESAQDYALWLGKVTGRAFRLPTEAEWEFAAAGPQGFEFPWGDSYIQGNANCAEMGLGQTTPVGAFPQGASWCGCLDLAGNVEEYTSTLYAPYQGGRDIKDDLLETLGSYPVTRGGSFARFRDLLRSRRRHGPYPQPTYPTGFRLAESLEV